MLRLELLNARADLERELETFVLHCTRCGLEVHRVSGLGVSPGHWAHAEPAPHATPKLAPSQRTCLQSVEPVSEKLLGSTEPPSLLAR